MEVDGEGVVVCRLDCCLQGLRRLTIFFYTQMGRRVKCGGET